MRLERMRSARGFTLVEALVAVALCVTVSVGVAQLVVVATRAVRVARERTSTAILAAAKMDELRSLAWTYEPTTRDTPAVPRSDFETDVSEPSFPAWGSGLSPSPAGALSTNTVGYVDYLDDAGRWVGRDALPPPNAVFARRWAIWPLPADPERTIVLQVLVTTIRDDRERGAWNGPMGSDTVLLSVRSRKGQ